LYSLKSLGQLTYGGNPSLSRQEMERFKKVVPSCKEDNSLRGALTLPPPVAELARKRLPWWSSLDEQWRTIFRTAIGTYHDSSLELVATLNLAKLDCHSKKLTHLEPLRACPGLQALNCNDNQLTSLEPLYGLKNLKELDCRNNPSLSEPEIERFQKAVPSCEIRWGTGSDSPIDADGETRWSTNSPIRADYIEKTYTDTNYEDW